MFKYSTYYVVVYLLRLLFLKIIHFSVQFNESIWLSLIELTNFYYNKKGSFTITLLTTILAVANIRLLAAYVVAKIIITFVKVIIVIDKYDDMSLYFFFWRQHHVVRKDILSSLKGSFVIVSLNCFIKYLKIYKRYSKLFVNFFDKKS